MAESSDELTEINDTPDDIIKIQQEFYELFGHKHSIIYDSYTNKESLEVKIDLIMPDMRDAKKKILTEIIWAQRKFTGDKFLLMSPIFICCIYDTNIKDHLTYPLDIKSKRFSLHPVFRIQKCICTLPKKDQTKCCALFVDEFARVYGNWKDFRDNNKYEDSLVVTPKFGIYNGSADDCVLLDIFIRKSGLTRNLDTGSTVVGLASAGVAAAGKFVLKVFLIQVTISFNQFLILFDLVFSIYTICCNCTGCHCWSSCCRSRVCSLHSKSIVLQFSKRKIFLKKIFFLYGRVYVQHTIYTIDAVTNKV